jgi:putative ABC transport system ATP-binding protein
MTAPVYSLEEVRAVRSPSGGAPAFELEVPLFRVAAGEKVALVGPSGCGKSTLIDILAFSMRPSAVGRFVFRGSDERETDIATLWARNGSDDLGDLRRKNIGVVLQTGGLLPFLSAGENIRLPRILSERVGEGGIDAIIDRLGIRRLLGKKPSALSVGERQRVSIARALAHDPILVIADEPTASLDEDAAAETMRLLVELVERLNVTLILSTHDTDMVDRYGFARARHDHLSPIQGHASVSRFWYDA